MLRSTEYKRGYDEGYRDGLKSAIATAAAGKSCGFERPFGLPRRGVVSDNGR